MRCKLNSNLTLEDVTENCVGIDTLIFYFHMISMALTTRVAFTETHCINGNNTYNNYKHEFCKILL